MARVQGIEVEPRHVGEPRECRVARRRNLRRAVRSLAEESPRRGQEGHESVGVPDFVWMRLRKRGRRPAVVVRLVRERPPDEACPAGVSRLDREHGERIAAQQGELAGGSHARTALIDDQVDTERLAAGDIRSVALVDGHDGEEAISADDEAASCRGCMRSRAGRRACERGADRHGENRAERERPDQQLRASSLIDGGPRPRLPSNTVAGGDARCVRKFRQLLLSRLPPFQGCRPRVPRCDSRVRSPS